MKRGRVILSAVAAAGMALAGQQAFGSGAPKPAPAASSDMLAAAFAAAFPKGIGKITDDEFNETTKAERLIPVGKHYAVVAVKTIGGAHPDPGALAVCYVDRVNGRFVPVGPAVRELNGSYGQIDGWSLRTDLTRSPIIVLKDDLVWQGCTEKGVILIALDQDQPRTVAYDIPLGFKFDSGDPKPHFIPSFKTRLERHGNAIRVRYKGSELDCSGDDNKPCKTKFFNTVVTFRRKGNSYVPDKKSYPDATC